MYFISPFTMEGDDGDVEIDITYRHYENKDSLRFASCKFTFYSEVQGIEKVSSAYFFVEKDSTKFELSNLDRFFVERENNKARYEGKIAYSDLKKIFSTDDFKFCVVTPQKVIMYGPDGTVENTRTAVRKEMLDLITD